MCDPAVFCIEKVRGKGESIEEGGRREAGQRGEQPERDAARDVGSVGFQYVPFPRGVIIFA
jgi:hypothetical protein